MTSCALDIKMKGWLVGAVVGAGVLWHLFPAGRFLGLDSG
jgi:hypothetical protein